MFPESHASHAPAVTDIPFSANGVTRLFFGQETLAQSIETALQPLRLHLSPWSDGIRVAGDQVAANLASEILAGVRSAVEDSCPLDGALVRRISNAVIGHQLKHDLVYHLQGLPHPLRPLSLSQVAFLDGIFSSAQPVAFGIGPTGAGKTYLALAAGLHLITEAHPSKMIITRPRVMVAGETMTPALRSEMAYDDQLMPIEDALSDMLGHDEMRRRIEHGLIEILPLGRLRGRTLNDCVIVVDGAQNLMIPKMRMVLTRLGRGSRMILVGNLDQCDLPEGETSGLRHILPLIAEANLASIHRFDPRQIVRNEFVARIDALYGRQNDPMLRDVA